LLTHHDDVSFDHLPRVHGLIDNLTSAILRQASDFFPGQDQLAAPLKLPLCDDFAVVNSAPGSSDHAVRRWALNLGSVKLDGRDSLEAWWAVRQPSPPVLKRFAACRQTG